MGCVKGQTVILDGSEERLSLLHQQTSDLQTEEPVSLLVYSVSQSLNILP
jgi:hypothetical protein